VGEGLEGQGFLRERGGGGFERTGVLEIKGLGEGLK
jgi:hypothetical protein